MKSDAASKDLQTVYSVVALNFHIDPDRVATIYQDVEDLCVHARGKFIREPSSLNGLS